MCVTGWEAGDVQAWVGLGQAVGHALGLLRGGGGRESRERLAKVSQSVGGGGRRDRKGRTGDACAGVSKRAASRPGAPSAPPLPYTLLLPVPTPACLLTCLSPCLHVYAPAPPCPIPLPHPTHLHAHDALDLLLAQRVEDDELVDAVHELGPEVAANLRQTTAKQHPLLTPLHQINSGGLSHTTVRLAAYSVLAVLLVCVPHRAVPRITPSHLYYATCQTHGAAPLTCAMTRLLMAERCAAALSPSMAAVISRMLPLPRLEVRMMMAFLKETTRPWEAITKARCEKILIAASSRTRECHHQWQDEHRSANLLGNGPLGALFNEPLSGSAPSPHLRVRCAAVVQYPTTYLANPHPPQRLHTPTCESVTRPSSSICSSTLNTSACAFSTSSNRMTAYGRRRTASVSWPPSS